MEPTNNGRPPYPALYDATFSPPDPRRELGHHAPIPPMYWPQNQTAVPPLYSMYSPYPPNLDSPHQMRLSGGPPLPDPTSRGYLPYPHPMPMPQHPAPWNDSFSQMPGPIQTNHAGMPPGQARPAFGPPTSVAPADNELVQSGLAMSSDAPPHGIYTSQHHPGMHPDHVAGHSASSLQSPNSPSETEENAPNATVDQLLDQVLDEGAANNTFRSNARQTQATDSISRKMAWKFAHHVLKKVEIQDLPESERTCAICYNDYGTESPEGLCEEPLRLPTYLQQCLGSSSVKHHELADT
ncbi:hypothetical protein MKX07_002627 [Trichoderma sp. CBMAI-0711]|nr:hypothetical protein MKX07_002627 [Trichoderma sp. CBMAI-0711]